MAADRLIDVAPPADKTFATQQAAILEELQLLFKLSAAVLETVAGADAITATVTPALTDYDDTPRVTLKVAATNTGPVTLNVDGNGAKAVKKAGGAALGAGDLISGQNYELLFDDVLDYFQVVGPVGAGGSGDMVGPGSSIDEGLSRFDGAGGKLLQDSGGATMDDAGKIKTIASVAGSAGLNLPHGTAPSSPVNGDVWSTTVAAFARINGTTLQFAVTGHTHVAADVSDFDTQVRLSRLDQMAVPTVDVSFNSKKITTLATPTAATDAATKAYVDAAIDGLSWKSPPARCATTADITLSGEQTIDGVTTSTDDVLVKDQSTGSENGLYTSAAGAWTRRADFDEDAEVLGATAIPVSEGTANGDKGFRLTTDDPIVVGTTALTFVVIASGAGGETNTGSNVGSDGIGVFDGKVSVDLQFRHIAPANASVTVVLNGNDLDIDVAAATTALAGKVEFATAAEFRNNTAARGLLTTEVWLAAAKVTLTDAATIAVDMSAMINAKVTITANRTLGNPSGEKEGQTGFFEILQNGTGGWTLAYESQYVFGENGTAPVVAAGANDLSVLYYTVLETGKILLSYELDVA